MTSTAPAGTCCAGLGVQGRDPQPPTGRPTRWVQIRRFFRGWGSGGKSTTAHDIDVILHAIMRRDVPARASPDLYPNSLLYCAVISWATGESQKMLNE